MGIPLYGQNKQGGKVDDILINAKNVWSFDRPPIVIDDGVLGGSGGHGPLLLNVR